MCTERTAAWAQFFVSLRVTPAYTFLAPRPHGTMMPCARWVWNHSTTTQSILQKRAGLSPRKVSHAAFDHLGLESARTSYSLLARGGYVIVSGALLYPSRNPMVLLLRRVMARSCPTLAPRRTQSPIPTQTGRLFGRRISGKETAGATERSRAPVRTSRGAYSFVT